MSSVKSNAMTNKYRKLKAKMSDRFKNMKQGGTWMKVENWLNVSKLVVGVGMIIFIISMITKQIDGELVAYYWMAGGVITTIIMSTILLSRKSGNHSIGSFIEKMFSLYVPSLVTLVPIIALIVIFHEVKRVLHRSSAHLPSQFYTFHYLTFFFLTLQLVLLNNFFNGEVRALLAGITNPNKAAYMAALLLTTLVSLVSVAELYIIITRFITDG